eukprot:PLAT7016.17.p2 GENE.PLAT7016.17~~PLAT7016.17.p2  ORF type:complete len:263 (-),score=122.52 PLAT7016.17:793-1581(-)
MESSGAGVDLSALSAELAAAEASESKRKAENDAKFRAVAQNASYDEFRNIVACAEMKPISREDIAHRPGRTVALRYHGKSAKKPRRRRRGRTSKADSDAAAAAALSSRLPSKPPRTSFEFEKLWGRSSDDAAGKFAYLQLCGADSLAAMFRTELDAALLASFITVFAALPEEQDAAILSLLLPLSTVGRLELTLSLMSADDLTALAALLRRLRTAAEAEGRSDELAEACGRFGVAADEADGATAAAAAAAEEADVEEGEEAE